MSVIIEHGFCAGCGTVIYWQERHRLKEGSRLWSTRVVAQWPPQDTYDTEVVRAYMATESGPDICHCHHCGRRIEGADQC